MVRPPGVKLPGEMTYVVETPSVVLNAVTFAALLLVGALTARTAGRAVSLDAAQAPRRAA